MTKFCSECGQKLGADDIFCPNCGETVENRKSVNNKDYEDLIRDIIYINDNGDVRLSKAKLIGVGFFILIVFGNMFFTIPGMLRIGFLLFFMTVLACFISGLIYYGICRGVGYLIRNYLIK